MEPRTGGKTRVVEKTQLFMRVEVGKRLERKQGNPGKDLRVTIIEGLISLRVWEVGVGEAFIGLMAGAL